MMENPRFKITINWHGEVHIYFRHATSAPQALRHSIRQLARETDYATKTVRDWVMDSGQRRWEVSK